MLRGVLSCGVRDVEDVPVSYRVLVRGVLLVMSVRHGMYVSARVSLPPHVDQWRPSAHCSAHRGCGEPTARRGLTGGSISSSIRATLGLARVLDILANTMANNTNTGRSISSGIRATLGLARVLDILGQLLP